MTRSSKYPSKTITPKIDKDTCHKRVRKAVKSALTNVDIGMFLKKPSLTQNLSKIGELK